MSEDSDVETRIATISLATGRSSGVGTLGWLFANDVFIGAAIADQRGRWQLYFLTLQRFWTDHIL